MQETYSVRNAETTPDRRDRKAEQARARRARQTERRKALNILNEMKELRVQRRLGEARKSKPVVAGDGKPRYFKIGANVAAMCCRLWYWENKGELAGHWTHKTARQWERETGLNERQQRTARRTAVEEGLWEEREHVRPDGRRVVKYRLDPVRMARLSVESAVESARRELGREVRAAEREKLARELPELEADRDLLRLFDAPEEPEGAGPDREPDTTPTYAVGDAPTQTPHGNAENGASEGERGDPQYTPEKELRYAENGASEGVGRTGTPYRVSGDPLHSGGTTREYYMGVLQGISLTATLPEGTQTSPGFARTTPSSLVQK